MTSRTQTKKLRKSELPVELRQEFSERVSVIVEERNKTVDAARAIRNKARKDAEGEFVKIQAEAWRKFTQQRQSIENELRQKGGK